MYHLYSEYTYTLKYKKRKKYEICYHVLLQKFLQVFARKSLQRTSAIAPCTCRERGKKCIEKKMKAIHPYRHFFFLNFPDLQKSPAFQVLAKGQLISKCLFVFFNSSKKFKYLPQPTGEENFHSVFGRIEKNKKTFRN